MNNRIIIVASGLLLMFTFLVACNKKTPPATPSTLAITVLNTSTPIDTATICGTPYNNVLKIKTGTDLIFKFHFTGTNPLAQYKIDIHSNFDCHAHQRPLQAWQYLEVKELNSTDTIFTESISIPASVFAGNYHCIIRLIDEYGNEADFVEYNLVIHNTEDEIPPTINLLQPASDSISIQNGALLTFQGSVNDNYSLSNGKLIITYAKQNGATYTAINEIFSDTAHLSHLFNRTYTIPSYIDTGLYIFTLDAFDQWNNNSTMSIKVLVIE